MMDMARSTAIGVEVLSRDATSANERSCTMEAYMLDLDLNTATQAEANRDSAAYDPFGSWSLQTGGGQGSPKNG